MCVRAVQGEAKKTSQLRQEVHFQTILPNYSLFMDCNPKERLMSFLSYFTNLKYSGALLVLSFIKISLEKKITKNLLLRDCCCCM